MTSFLRNVISVFAVLSCTGLGVSKEHPISFNVPRMGNVVIDGNAEDLATPLDEQLWNLSFRVLLREVAATDSEKRDQLWQRSIHKLANPSICLHEKTFEDLDKLNNALSEGNSLSPIRVLTDLLLLAPDVSSIRRIQCRRIAEFSKAKAWEDAQAAAALNIVLSTFTPDGPVPAIKRYLEIKAMGGGASLSPGEVMTIMCSGSQRDIGKDGERTGPEPAAMDTPLKWSAEQALGGLQDQMGSRRKAFLSIFAGRTDDGVRHMHKVLLETPCEGGRIKSALDDVAVALAIADGYFGKCMRFGIWRSGEPSPDQDLTQANVKTDSYLQVLTECERNSEVPGDKGIPATNTSEKLYRQRSQSEWAELADQAVSTWRRRLVRWSNAALRDGDLTSSACFWALAMQTEATYECVEALVDRMVDNVSGLVGPNETIAVIENSLSHVPSVPYHRPLLLRIARLQYGEGRFSEVLETLRRLSHVAREDEEAPDFAADILHATLQIRLGKLDDALDVLHNLQTWTGPPDEDAEILFLTGMAHLKKGSMTDALSALRRVSNRYPDTPGARKAGQLLHLLGEK